jgi:hypothetical protein
MAPIYFSAVGAVAPRGGEALGGLADGADSLGQAASRGGSAWGRRGRHAATPRGRGGDRPHFRGRERNGRVELQQPHAEQSGNDGGLDQGALRKTPPAIRSDVERERHRSAQERTGDAR